MSAFIVDMHFSGNFRLAQGQVEIDAVFRPYASVVIRMHQKCRRCISGYLRFVGQVIDKCRVRILADQVVF